MNPAVSPSSTTPTVAGPVVGDGFERRAGDDVIGAQQVCDHLDAAAARETGRVSGVVIEPEARAGRGSPGEHGVGQSDRIALDAPARDRPDDLPVGGDGHGRPDAARSTSSHRGDRDRGD